MGIEQDQDSASIEAERAIARHRLALQERFPMPTTRPRPRRTRTTIAALILVLGAAGLWWVDPAYRTDHLESLPGQRSTANLADGSVISLNTDTRLAITWHLRSRRVVLERGQALFDVSHAAWRPFTVDADHTHVTVVGTLFDVWRQPQAVRVTVLRGKVRVENTGPEAITPPVYLSANQQVSDDAAGLSRVAEVDAAARMAWKDGKLVFDRTPLAEALAELNRYTRRRIAPPDPQAASLLVSGVFDIARADAILALLPGILPVTLGRDAQGQVTVQRVASPHKTAE